MSKLAVMFVGVALAVASPVVARDRAKTEAPVAESTGSPVVQRATDLQRYCLVETPTGSHIQRKTCKTRADWLVDGFDPLAK